jgi:hypothetical protein
MNYSLVMIVLNDILLSDKKQMLSNNSNNNMLVFPHLLDKIIYWNVNIYQTKITIDEWVSS